MKTNIGLFLAKRALISPELEGFVDVATERRFSFKRLNERANRIANALLALGVAKGDRVAILQMNSVEYVETFFGAAKIGAIVVPLNWRLVPDELEFILKNSGAATLVYGQDFAASVEELQGRGEHATDLRKWVCIGGSDAKPAFALDYDEITGAASEAEPETTAWGDDLLYIMYTSGTTGLPKGVVHSHNTAFWGCATINTTADMRHADRYMVALPLFHVGALTPLTGAVYRGVTCVVLRAFDPAQAWELIEKEKISTMLAVPAMLNFMLQVPQKDTADFSTLRWIMSGAAPVPVSLIDKYTKMGIEIQQVYGLTETCGPACLTSPEDAVRKAGSTGKAFFHTDVKIVNGAGDLAEPNEIGELLVRGPHVMLGYWNNPEATADAVRNDWLHTGDLASMDDEGFCYIQDRKKDMIISGGENVYPAEIENIILAHPNVKDVAVIGQPSAKWGESAAAIVVKGDDALSSKEVLVHCEGKMARFKQPQTVEFVSEIPRNPTGKALKRILRDQFPGPAPS